MRIDLSPEQEALRAQIRGYYRDLFAHGDLRARLDAEWDQLGGPAFREAMGRMGKEGWLTIGWPREWGGQGRSHLEQFIFWDETWRARAPLPLITVNTVGPMLMKYGTNEQKSHFLGRIRDGEMLFGIGYSEPSAGTDLASLQTRAVRDGGEWVINGQKVFTTHAQASDYIWLAARTDPDAPKHKGISMFIVPRETPGVRIVPIKNMGEMNTNQTFYDNVRIPAGNLVGKLNGGWKLITNQLNHERVTLCSSGMIEGRFEELVQWAKQTKRADGSRVIDQEWVQINIARISARIAFLRLMNFKVAWGADAAQGRFAVDVEVDGTSHPSLRPHA